MGPDGEAPKPDHVDAELAQFALDHPGRTYAAEPDEHFVSLEESA